MSRPSLARINNAFVIALSAWLTVGCAGSPDEAALSSDALHVSCLERPESGRCRAARPAFYYDYATDVCKQFLWGGCGENVPFESMDDCLSACGATQR